MSLSRHVIVFSWSSSSVWTWNTKVMSPKSWSLIPSTTTTPSLPLTASSDRSQTHRLFHKMASERLVGLYGRYIDPSVRFDNDGSCKSSRLAKVQRIVYVISDQVVWVRARGWYCTTVWNSHFLQTETIAY